MTNVSEALPFVRVVVLHKVSSILSDAKLVKIVKDVVKDFANTRLQSLAKAAFDTIQPIVLQPIFSHDNLLNIGSFGRINVLQLRSCSKADKSSCASLHVPLMIILA